jgi:hypothetical protein
MYDALDFQQHPLTLEKVDVYVCVCVWRGGGMYKISQSNVAENYSSLSFSSKRIYATSTKTLIPFERISVIEEIPYVKYGQIFFSSIIPIGPTCSVGHP